MCTVVVAVLVSGFDNRPLSPLFSRATCLGTLAYRWAEHSFPVCKKRGGGRTTLLANRSPFAHANFLPSYFWGDGGGFTTIVPYPLILYKKRLLPTLRLEYKLFLYEQYVIFFISPNLCSSSSCCVDNLDPPRGAGTEKK